jgi:hypothetical protein
VCAGEGTSAAGLQEERAKKTLKRSFLEKRQKMIAM